MFKFFKNGNKKAKESYYTVHNVLKAQTLASGEGVKIGIVDWLFGDEKSKKLEGYFDATGTGFIDNKEHGFAMVNILKEIAPKCKVYAINGITKECFFNDNLRVAFLEQAVKFAVQNDIKILTYSHKPIEDKDAVIKLQKVLKIAEKNGIITIFLHCAEKENVMPVAIDSNVKKSRAQVFNIYQYDYSNLNPVAYKKWIQSGGKDNSCFLSWSSMAPVLAGFIAFLLGTKPDLTKKQIINILKKSCQNGVIDAFCAIKNVK